MKNYKNMKHLFDYINEEKELTSIHENLAVSRIVAASIAAGASSRGSSRSYRSSDDKNEASDVAQNISGILRACALMGGITIAGLTGAAAITAGVVLMIMAVSTIPLGKWIDSAIEGVKKIKKNDVSESLDDLENKNINEGFIDKLKEIKNKIKEKSIKAFAKIVSKNDNIRSILDDMKKANGYNEAIKSKDFNTLAKFVGEYFKNKKDVAEKVGKELKNDDTTLSEV